MKSENEAARPHIGAQEQPVTSIGHMPFRGHRTVAELWADELRASMMRGGGAR